MRQDHVYDFPCKQSGSTLIVSLIILILLMLLGVTAMTTSDTQFKLTGNLQFENLAMNNAETAAGFAERWLESVAATAASASAVGSLPNPLTGMAWTNADSVQVVANDDTQRYVIGWVSTNPSPLAGVGLDCTAQGNEHNFDCVNTYLITARGQSGRGATKYVQTYYAVPLK
jgi:Tfp pilus assembly protein PilX